MSIDQFTRFMHAKSLNLSKNSLHDPPISSSMNFFLKLIDFLSITWCAWTRFKINALHSRVTLEFTVGQCDLIRKFDSDIIWINSRLFCNSRDLYLVFWRKFVSIGSDGSSHSWKYFRGRDTANRYILRFKLLQGKVVPKATERILS